MARLLIELQCLLTGSFFHVFFSVPCIVFCSCGFSLGRVVHACIHLCQSADVHALFASVVDVFFRFGYVEFEDVGAAQGALKSMKGATINDRNVHLDFAQERTGGSPGRGGGGFGENFL